MKLTADEKTNYLNILLMFITMIFAYYAPFETFLLAYAFLGPLHYLTEISWLHDRQYYSKGKYDFIVLLAIGVLISFAVFTSDTGLITDFYKWFASKNLFDQLLVLALFSSVLFALVKNAILKTVAILFLFVVIAGWLSPANAEANQRSTTVFALTSLVPTLIHVYLFTGLFVLFGALKARSISGLISLVAYIIFPLALVFYMPVSPNGTLSEYGKKAYYADGEGFFSTNVSIIDHFGLSPNMTNKQYLDYFVNDSVRGAKYSAEEKAEINNSFKDKLNEDYIVNNEESAYYQKPVPFAAVKEGGMKENYWSIVFFSPLGIMLMRFIAFAYLYHYLNWFSKTKVIKWHEVPKQRFAVVILLWLVACGLYLYNYATGLKFLFFLSFSHVLLEFPLNILSIVGIGKETISIFRHGFKKDSLAESKA